MKTVKKKWGKEEWIVNCREYCGKFLHIVKGAVCSYHYHKTKKETFYCLHGHVILNLCNANYILQPATNAVTILPKQPHSFRGLNNDNILLEISTHHSDNDVVRLTESKNGMDK